MEGIKNLKFAKISSFNPESSNQFTSHFIIHSKSIKTAKTTKKLPNLKFNNFHDPIFFFVIASCFLLLFQLSVNSNKKVSDYSNEKLIKGIIEKFLLHFLSFLSLRVDRFFNLNFCFFFDFLKLGFFSPIGIHSHVSQCNNSKQDCSYRRYKKQQ